MSLFLLAITLPVVFIVFYGDQVIPQNANNQNLKYVTTATWVLVGIGIIYLLYHYFSEWWAVCRESNVGWFKGLSVVTFTLYLILLLVDITNQSYGFLNPAIVSLIENQIHVRTILLVLILVHTLSVAFINSAKNKIERPKDVFAAETPIIPLWNPKPFPNQFLNTILIMAKALINAALTFYKNFGQILKAIVNMVKIIIEYIIKLFINYVFEILKLIKVFLTIFFSTTIRFFRSYALPLILCYLLTYGIHLVAENLYYYVNEGELSHEHSVLTLLGIFIGLILLVWSITRFKFSNTLNSVAVSNMWFAFTLFISTLVASWGLWLAAQFLSESPFKGVGHFTAVSSILLLLALVAIFSIRFRSREGI